MRYRILLGQLAFWGRGGGHTRVEKVAIRSPTPTVCLRPATALELGVGHTVSDLPADHRCELPNQRGATALGPVYCAAFVCRSCLCNAHNALYHRHLCPFPVVSAQMYYPLHFRAAVAAAYRHLLPSNRDEWFDRWPEWKRDAIVRSELDDRYEFGSVDANIKREVAHKLPKRGRLIQAYRNLRTQAHYAHEHSVFQKALFVVAGGDDIAGYELFPGIYVSGTSGWSNAQLADWADRHHGRVLYERDCARFDSTMQLCHHMLKWAFMRACDPLFAERVMLDYRVRGRFRTRDGTNTTLEYTSFGAVKSGHCDTTSGNTLNNLVITACAMHDCGMRGNVLAIGDDLLCAIEGRPDLAALARREACYGIIPEVKTPASFAQATYASSTWLYDGTRHIYVPLLGRLFARQWWSVDPPGSRPSEAWRQRRHGVACGMLSIVGGVPLYDEFYRPHLIPGRATSDLTAVRYRPHGPALNQDAARGAAPFDFDAAYALRYGFTPTECRVLAQRILEVGIDPCYVVTLGDDLVERVMRVDFGTTAPAAAPDCASGHAGLDVLRQWGVFDPPPAPDRRPPLAAAAGGKRSRPRLHSPNSRSAATVAPTAARYLHRR